MRGAPDPVERHVRAVEQTGSRIGVLICALANSTVEAKPSRPFEFPDGFNSYFGTMRMTVPEVLFNPQRFLPKEVRAESRWRDGGRGRTDRPSIFQQFTTLQLPPSASTIPSHPYNALQPIQRLVSNALVQIDPDLHPTFFSNIVVTGGTTLTQGFTDRLQAELAAMSSSMKLKIRTCC